MLKKIRIALYDSDGYMRMLVQHLCKNRQGMIEARVFTDIGLLETAAGKGQVDILLAQEEVGGEISHLKEGVPRIVLLTEEKELQKDKDFAGIFRYQSASNIAREIMALLAEDDNIMCVSHVLGHQTAEIICGYAPFGGAGVTSHLLKLARESSQEQETLFVSLEEFHGLGGVLAGKKGQGRESYQGMSEVIFYLKQRKNKLALKLESLVSRREGFDILPAVEHYQDLQQLSVEDVDFFLKMLLEAGRYGKIFFDIGHLSTATLSLMEQSSRVWIPDAVSDMQKEKREFFLMLLAREERQGLLDKIVCTEKGGD